MKKRIAVMLCLLLVISLSACGKKATNEVSGIPTQPVQTTAAAAVETEAPVPEETIPETTQTVPVPVETEPAPAFDTGWADGAYAMVVPQPPYTYEVFYSESQNLYTIQNADLEEEITYESMAAYCDTLKSIGYANITQDTLSADDFQAALAKTGGAATLFAGENESGIRVNVYKEFSTWWIMVYMN